MYFGEVGGEGVTFQERSDEVRGGRGKRVENMEFENSGATGARSNNSLDAPPRSSVTRTVRAFYSARGDSR